MQIYWFFEINFLKWAMGEAEELAEHLLNPHSLLNIDGLLVSLFIVFFFFINIYN